MAEIREAPPDARRVGLVLVQLLLGAAMALALGIGARVLLQRAAMRRLPEGYAIVRPPHEVSALALHGDTVWAGGSDGLYAIDRLAARVSPLPSDAPNLRRVRDLLVDAEGRLWIAHRDGLTALHEGTWRTWTAADGLLPGPTLSLCLDRDGRLWVGGENGVSMRDGEGWRQITTADGLGAPEVDVIFQDGAGVMWFGSASPTRGGLSRYDGRSWQFFTTREGLTHDSVNAIIEARDGTLWIATGFADRGGATRLADGEWSGLTRQDGLAGEKVRTVFQDHDDRLWFGSEYDGLAIHDGATWRILTPEDGLSGWEVKEIVQDRDGAYWLGTEDGVTRIEHWRTIAGGG
jgi:ligand-binding sensor domain-containing protein